MDPVNAPAKFEVCVALPVPAIIGVGVAEKIGKSYSCMAMSVQCFLGCSVSVVVGRRTSDREIASSVPGWYIAG